MTPESRCWRLSLRVGSTAGGAGIRGGKYFLGEKQAVEGSWKSCVDGHVNDGLDDFGTSAAGVESQLKMSLQLRSGVAHGRQCRDGDQFPGAQIEAWTGENVAKGELDDVAGEIGSDVRQAVGKALCSLRVHLRQLCKTSLVSLVITCHGLPSQCSDEENWCPREDSNLHSLARTSS